MPDPAGRRRPFWYLRRGPETVRSDVEEELDLHLELRAEELRAGGMSSTEAHREALRQFGDVERTRQYCRSQDEQKETRMQRALMLEDFAQDVRISVSQSAACADVDADHLEHGRPWHRRDDGDIQRRERRPAAAAAVCPAGPARPDLHRHAAVRLSLLGGRLSGAAGATDALRAGCRVHRTGP